MTYYLLFISYLFWTMEMMLDNQIWAIFSFEFKMNHKAVETTQWCTGPGTVDECTVQWWFKKFYKGDESLDDEEHSGQPLEVANDKLRGIIKADPLTATQERVEELNIDHSMVIRHLKQIRKVKKLNKRVPRELTKI